MTFLLRRFADLLHAGGLPFLVVLVTGAASVVLALCCLFRERRTLSKAAAVLAGATAIFAVAGGALNWYSVRTMERELQTGAIFARIPPGAKATLLMANPWLPVIGGALAVGLWLGLSLIAKRRAS
jgi:hypothetical protein